MKGFPGGSVVKNPSAMQDMWQELRFDPWVRKIPWKRKWQPTPVFLPGESHGQRSLAGATIHGIARVRYDLATKPPLDLTRDIPKLSLPV